MAEVVLALPISVEQVAIVINQMSQADQERLLEVVPSLSQLAVALASVRTIGQMQANIERLQAEVLAVQDNQSLSPDEPFLEGFTLGQYHDLPDEQKAKLWDRWANVDITELEEQEVSPNALSTG